MYKSQINAFRRIEAGYRQEKGYSIKYMAKQLGVDVKTYGKYKKNPGVAPYSFILSVLSILCVPDEERSKCVISR